MAPEQIFGAIDGRQSAAVVASADETQIGDVAAVRVLLAGGAARTARERGHGVTAQGWAELTGHAAVVSPLAG